MQEEYDREMAKLYQEEKEDTTTPPSNVPPTQSSEITRQRRLCYFDRASQQGSFLRNPSLELTYEVLNTMSMYI